MTMPFYVAPEQVMKDRAEYAQKGIARGRSLVASVYAEGILVVAENPSRSLHKISEIYDRIAFAGVGKYNEFDQLRVAGVRHADTKGFAYSREDVDARSLANLYAQFLGQVFTHEMKPLEVEILVAELGADGSPTSSTTSPTRHDHRRGPLRRARRGDRDHLDRVARGLSRTAGASTWPCGPRWGRSPGPTGRSSRRPRGRRAGPGQRPPGVPPAGPRRVGRAPGAEGASRAPAGASGSGSASGDDGAEGSGPAPPGRRRARRDARRLDGFGGVLHSSNSASTWSASMSSLASPAWPTSTSTSTGPGRG